MLAVVAAKARSPDLPAEAQDALRRVTGLGADELEALAGAVLAGTVDEDRLALAPFVGAALQAWFASLAAGLDPAAVAPGQGACPVCGGAPVAGVVQGDRLRYVTCALCAAEWHALRTVCVACGGEKLEYLHAEGDRGAKAEACGSCRAYLKVFDLEHRGGADAAADDAATIALDLLVAEEGYHRAGPNLYVAPGVGGVGVPASPGTDPASAARPA
jgi:FdhE protein